MRQDDSEDSDYMLNDAMRKNIKKTAANLRVKIIPDITANAALDGSSFDTTLTQDKLEWMEKIRSTWVACTWPENCYNTLPFTDCPNRLI